MKVCPNSFTGAKNRRRKSCCVTAARKGGYNGSSSGRTGRTKIFVPSRSSACRTNVQVYFCDPRSPWQRGSNENTNGLLRQYFPRRTDLSRFSQDYLNRIAGRLNQRPRKTLGF